MSSFACVQFCLRQVFDLEFWACGDSGLDDLDNHGRGDFEHHVVDNFDWEGI